MTVAEQYVLWGYDPLAKLVELSQELGRKRECGEWCGGEELATLRLYHEVLGTLVSYAYARLEQVEHTRSSEVE